MGLRAAALAGVLFAMLAWRVFARGRTLDAWRMLACTQCIALIALLAVATPYADTRSSKVLIAAAATQFRLASEVYSIGELDQSLPFYLRRPVTLVDFINEFKYGMSAEPGKASLTLEAFRDRWRATARPIAVIAPERIADVEALGLPATIVFRNRRGAVLGPEQTLIPR